VKGMFPGGAFQLTTADVRGQQLKVFKNLPPALGDYYRHWLKQYAGKDFFIYQDERHTFGQVQAQLDALGAELMASFGVKRGDKVGIAMRNLPEYMIAFLAITACGAVAVPLNSMWGASELEYAVKDSGAKVLIADTARLKLCQPFLSTLGVTAILVRGDAAKAQEMGATATWADVLKAGSARPVPSTAGILPEDEAMLMYTSGSTGFPKGVVHTQRSVGTCMKVGELASAIIPDPDPRVLLAVPLFHITALAMVFLWCVPSGTSLYIINRWDAGEALKVISENKITRFTGVPTMIKDMMDHPTFTPEKVKTIKSMAAGGAPVPPSQVDQLHKATGRAASTQGYGLTEAHIATMNKGVDYLKHPKSCGKAIPFLVELQVQDPDGKALPDGERGELCIRSAMLMSRYHNRPEDTAKVLDSKGFFHSGDVAKIEGGFVYILDRLKDLIIRGGENIDCSEVEAAMYTHPAVRECSVFGLPDERLGEVVGCTVYWQGDQAPTTADLSAHAASKLAKYKVPLAEHIFLLTEALPKGATGKIDKKGMRETYSAMVKGPPASKL